MIGQDKLVNQLNNLNINDFPTSLILCGEVGCGKHTLCSLIQNKFSNWEFNYVECKIDYDFVESCYLSSIPIFYIINSDKLSEREQNAILKLFEEPPSNVHIIFLSSSLALLLPTIINRAVVWTFDKYSRETLKSFLGDSDSSILDFATTPGQVLGLTNGNYQNIIDLANLIIDKVNFACTSNVLSLTKKFNLTKDDVSGFDVVVFTRIMRKLLFNRVKDNDSIKYINAYFVTNEFYKNLLVSTYNKKYIFQEYILSLKESLNES